MKTPPPVFLSSRVLSLLKTLYPGGKISLFEISGFSHDSVTRIRSGSVSSMNSCSSAVLFLRDWQLIIAILRLSLVGVLFLVGHCFCGDDAAWGSPGDDSVGLAKEFEWSCRGKVGVFTLVLILLKDSDRLSTLGSSECMTGGFRRMAEKFGWSHLGQIHDVSVSAKVLNRMVDIPRHSL